MKCPMFEMLTRPLEDCIKSVFGDKCRYVVVNGGAYGYAIDSALVQVQCLHLKDADVSAYHERFTKIIQENKGEVFNAVFSCILLAIETSESPKHEALTFKSVMADSFSYAYKEVKEGNA